MTFYIYATSAARYPGNTQSDFKFELPYPIHLNETYYCALSEIHIGNNQVPLPSEKDRTYSFSWGETESELERNATSFTIPHMYYKNISELIATLNASFEIYISNIFNVSFSYVEEYHKLFTVCTRNPPYHYLKFSKVLSSILGFIPDEWNKITYGLASKNVNFTPSITNLYLTTNLTEPERVGNEMLPLLRKVVLQSENVGAYMSLTFNPRQYKLVRLKDIDVISIQILDEQGQLAEFEGSGEVICALHFTPASAL